MTIETISDPVVDPLPPGYAGVGSVADGISERRRRGILDKERLGRVLFLITLVVFLGGWEFASRRNIVDPFLMSRPSAIAKAMWRMFVTERTIYEHLLASGQELALGLGAAIIVGVPAGLVMGQFRLVEKTFEPYIVALLSTPSIALMPLFLVWLGVGLTTKVVLIFVGSVFIVIVNTAAGVQNIDRRWLDAGHVFMAGRLRLFIDVILPGSAPSVVVGLRLGITRGLITMYVAELYASNKGIGFLITDSGSRYQIDEFFVGVLVLAATGIGLSASLRWLEHGLLSRFRP